MLQTNKAPGQVCWPTAMVDPIVSRPKTWKGSIRKKRVPNFQPQSISDVAVLYPEAVVASSDPFAWTHPRNTFAPQLERDGCTSFRQSPSRLEPERTASSACSSENVTQGKRPGEVAIVPAGTLSRI